MAELSASDFAAVDAILALASTNGAAVEAQEHWLIDAADLLAEPDPGPTPWLIQDLIVDQALIACVGRWKTTKSYGLLDLCISIATGEPAFGQYEIPQPGTVIFINEESGRTALRRRLDSLCRGRDIEPERLRGTLLVGANTQIKLDSERWQHELIELGRVYQPRLFVFDPLARMKAASREENAQTEMAPLIEFLRLLRHETGAAVSFVHHTGHQGEQMRGSSDLESFWETRLTWKRDGQSPLVAITSEHREAENCEPISYRIMFDSEERAMRFDSVQLDRIPTLGDRIMVALVIHQEDGMTTEQVRAEVNVRLSDVTRTLETLEMDGKARRVPSQRRDVLGRRVSSKVWKPADQAENTAFTTLPEPGKDQEGGRLPSDVPTRRPTSLEVGGTEGASNSLSEAHDDDIPF